MKHSSSQPPTSAIREKTEILYGTENVLGSLLEFLSKAKRIDSCGDSKSPSLVFEVDMYNKLLIDIKNRGVKVRQVTDITKENIRYCKELLKLGYEIRHLDDIKTNFSVSETEYLATAAALREAQPIPQIIYSNVKDIVEQQRYVFESFWNRAIPAETRINEIEKGIELEKTHVIQDPQAIQKLFTDLVKSAQHEVLLILPTVNAFLREHRIGIIQLLMHAAKERSVNVKILTPTNDAIDDLLKNMEVLSYQEGDRKKDFNFDLRSINISSEETAVSTVTIVAVDKKESLVFEKTDDTKENFIEAVGSATISNSKPTVMSYVSIFKSLWKQVDLYEQLKAHDKMQKEFINIASHEMKTPTQAIIGYADLMQKHTEKREDMIQAMSRNAIRLQRLTNDILDVTRIDSNTLHLHKEQFNLGELITSVIQDYIGHIEKENLNVKLLYNFKQDTDDPLPINADKDRITQVVSNLLDNAIKFTSKKTEGVISVSAETERKKDVSEQEVIVRIKDTGEGINREIQPRLFTKFATRSFSGTGLGLYISKSIVEAHGGRMWAENNPEGKGATFTFTLPLGSRKEIINSKRDGR
ncbi:MAG: ATP-binding protein [Thermoproteota archaeon]|nr:ATP-binding protein [Thermoproteota archaeon]